MTKEIKQIVWNGCDGYIFAEDFNPDYNISKNKDGTFTLFHRGESFNSFPVMEIGEETIEIDEDGELICDGIFIIGDQFFKYI